MRSLIAFLALFGCSLSQAQQTAYFQQEVNTLIEVTLNDSLHTLDGYIEITYVNRSPDTLKEMYMHLWANAYKDRNTAFARQKLRTGSSRFFFAKDSELGNFSKLDFQQNGNSISWDLKTNNPDIALLELAEPLGPGATTVIRTPFLLKIPRSFSRLGHVGQSYQLTQWFPKPAVYDREGWHPMPYLDMGEFYSEFGSYDVRITLPDNYIVAASGELQTESEQQFIKEQIQRSNRLLKDSLDESDVRFPPSSQKMKTIRYTAEQIHDFAWFADKRFYVQKSEVKMASGKTVDSWAFFTNQEGEMWKKGTFYVDRALEFYSELVGEYPYPQATAVQSALSAGGGMEYPMITVIGLMGSPQPLDEVITHEVGHNWFYGILGFNERDHVWLDEGINSYYDHRYTEKFYPNSKNEFFPEFFLKDTDMSMGEMAYLYQARRNDDQAPVTHSDDYSRVNYFLGGYEKPAQAFRMAQYYLGTELFDEIMQSFYQEWAFKHPQPADLWAHFRSKTDKDLSWLIDGLIGSNDKIDYAVKKLSSDGQGYQLKVQNKGQLTSPLPVAGMKDGKVVRMQWYEGFEGTKTLDFPEGEYDQILLDPKHYTLDINRQNDDVKVNGSFKRFTPLRTRFVMGMENTKRNSLYWLPTATWNQYDGLMLGAAVYNTVLPERKIEFALAPSYAFDSKQLNGIGFAQYNFYPKKGTFRKITLGANVKRYSSNFLERDSVFSTHLPFYRVAPTLDLYIRTDPAGTYRAQLQARSLFIGQESTDFDQNGQYIGNKTDRSLIHQISYRGVNNRPVNPYNFGLLLEQQSYDNPFGDRENYLKASFVLNASYTYERGRNIDFRLYVGKFILNSRRDSRSYSNALTRGSFALIHQGFNDYQFDEVFFGRNEQTNIWSQQVTGREGGFKNAFGSQQSIGQSNDFIASASLKLDLPINAPIIRNIKPYIDLGYFNRAELIGEEETFSDQFLYSGGAMLELLGGTFVAHFPFFNSDQIDQLYKQRSGGNYASRITFTLRLRQINPWRIREQLSF
ncbi:MAG: M1 family metallopeptidase [Bacteroidota bacterium]